MDAESVKSEQSSRSRRTTRQQSGSHRSRHSHRNHKSKRPDMAPFQTTVNLEDSRDGQEIIEVQILPQDENWGENTTAITGNTSEQSVSMEDVSNWQGGGDSGLGFACQRYMETTLSLILSLVAFFSPLAMVMMPKLGFFARAFDNADLTPIARSQLLACNAECKGQLVSLAVRMILLALALWAIFLRKPAATLPRIFLFRATVILLVLVSTFAFWLFYVVQVTEGTKAIIEGAEAADYKSLVTFATSFADTLLFIHYIAVILLEIRHQQPVYYVKVVRSPDGESRSYTIGQLSIQRAAVWVLQKYYTEFTIFNPYLERIPVSKSQRKALSTFKYYDVDGVNASQQQSQSRAVLAAHARRRDSSHNERFYEEHEYDRRVKKRRARLITAAEEAFTHIKRVHNEPAPAIPLDPQEAAQAVFPSMARALQKYLRVTRQQPRHTVEAILRHLAHCLKHDLAPRAFLEPYLVESPVMQSEKERRPVQSWSLICDELLSRPLSDGCSFQLIQSDISLVVTVHRLPHFHVAEEVVDPKSNKFVLKLNSETSV
ncbi:vang-like protein 2 [Phlebotomus argentipes]|uniref:vang-like protein 2 n=1 Tax=Phlebotomus argentipes TaxID=94469 RepID=UPI0028930928|nr:vang-like protein 2 [Phlebotomus argentipes]XP_059607484.1 vang-like protein 2 [Phlebotomus argentipes]